MQNLKLAGSWRSLRYGKYIKRGIPLSSFWKCSSSPIWVPWDAQEVANLTAFFKKCDPFLSIDFFRARVSYVICSYSWIYLLSWMFLFDPLLSHCSAAWPCWPKYLKNISFLIVQCQASLHWVEVPCYLVALLLSLYQLMEFSRIELEQIDFTTMRLQRTVQKIIGKTLKFWPKEINFILLQ